MDIFNLYTSDQAGQQVLNLALDMQLQGKHVRVLPLSQLPAPEPGRSRPVRLAEEQRDLRGMLSAVRFLLNEAGAAEHKYGFQVAQLHLDAARYETRLALIAAELLQTQLEGQE